MFWGQNYAPLPEDFFTADPVLFHTAETRQMLAADEQRREYFEEQRNEHENFVEEERHGKNKMWL